MVSNQNFIHIDRRDIDAAAKKFGPAFKNAIELAHQEATRKTAFDVRDAAVQKMEEVFDNPVRFTTNSLQTTFDKKTGVATVEPKDGYWSRADNYLDVQISGTNRKQKAFERALQASGLLPNGWHAVPGEAAKLDSFGNMSVGQIKQILSWFNAAEPYAGSTQNKTTATRAKARKGTRSKRGYEFFAARPGHRIGARSWKNGRTQNLTPGIYLRTFFSFEGARGGRSSSMQPVLIFVKNTSYRKRYPFYETARKAVEQNYERQFIKAFEKYAGRVKL